MGRQEHEQAHDRNRRPVNESIDGEPDEEVAGKALDCSGQVYQPGAATIRSDGGVEEAGEDAEVGADVLEDGDGVESRLIVRLGGFEERGVDAEGV